MKCPVLPVATVATCIVVMMRWIVHFHTFSVKISILKIVIRDFAASIFVLEFIVGA